MHHHRRGRVGSAHWEDTISSLYALAADLIVTLHALFVLFVVVGEVLILCGWRRDWAWTRGRLFRIGHLLAIGYVVLEVMFDLWCPLTVWENELRALAGQPTYAMSFIGYWLDRLLFYDAPPWVFDLAYTAFGLLVAFTYLRYPPRPPSRR